MKALVYDGTLAVRDVPTPEPGTGEATVRVSMAGICNTDIEIARGYMGFSGILGHEMVGVVEAAPDPALVGTRVTAEINLACGRCERCARGFGRHCASRTVLGILGKDGCFAERVTLPVRNLHAVPDTLSDEQAVFTEPFAAAFEVLELVHVEPMAEVGVLGDGKLGLLCATALRGTEANLTLVGKHERKLAHARKLGIPTQPADAVQPGQFDIVVEATGSPSGLDLALTAVRPRGTVVLKSTFFGRPEIDTAKVVIDEIRVVGSRCGPFPAALRSLRAGRADPTPLIDARYGLNDAVTAFEHTQRSGVLKVLLDLS
jgi:threonine dehydrogenase-like Zn-dependent dehydrogenase